MFWAKGFKSLEKGSYCQCAGFPIERFVQYVWTESAFDPAQKIVDGDLEIVSDSSQIFSIRLVGV